MSDDDPNVGKETFNKLVLFPSTYLRESRFSTLLHVKRKYRNRFNFTPGDDLRHALSTKQPRIPNLVENDTQLQKSQ